MKRLIVSLLAGMMALTGHAQAKDASDLAREIAIATLQASVFAEREINNLINWKVGEYTDYSLEAMGMPLGTMKKYVASEVGNNIWLNQDMEGGMIGNQKVEVLMDRATGQVLEMKQNGKNVEVPNDPIELIDQETTTITVPAGTFEVIHITARSKQAKKIEVWANPRDIALDGAAQMYIESGFLPMTMKLTKFGGR
jgi:hypothetical protein